MADLICCMALRWGEITCIVTANSSYKVASFLTEKQTNPNKIWINLISDSKNNIKISPWYIQLSIFSPSRQKESCFRFILWKWNASLRTLLSGNLLFTINDTVWKRLSGLHQMVVCRYYASNSNKRINYTVYEEYRTFHQKRRPCVGEGL